MNADALNRGLTRRATAEHLEAITTTTSDHNNSKRSQQQQLPRTPIPARPHTTQQQAKGVLKAITTTTTDTT